MAETSQSRSRNLDNQNTQNNAANVIESSPPPEEEVEKKNRPSDSKFKQQKLPAWQPVLTAGTVLPSFFFIGILFIPIGVGLLISSNNVKEVKYDYTECTDSSGKFCHEVVEKNVEQGKFESCKCVVTLEIPEDMEGTIYLYYGLSTFYQNHRRYVKSRSDDQLLGNPTTQTNCEPFKSEKGNPAFAPCGAIANSMFNDSIQISFTNGTSVAVKRTGIAWPSDRSKKFRNPTAADSCQASDQSCWKNAFDKTVPPPYWSKPVYQLDTTDKNNNGFLNEDFIVWMRTAALPTFRKLYRIFENEKLPKGNYTLNIDYSYPVKSFGGKKRVIISTTSWLGGKNPFLGVAYIVVGSVCILMGIVFLLIHKKFGKSLEDMANISGRA